MLDTDDVPDGISNWVENIFFPSNITAPTGNYTYWVVQYTQVGDADPWELQVLDMETVLQSQIGATMGDRNESVRFTFEYNP